MKLAAYKSEFQHSFFCHLVQSIRLVQRTYGTHLQCWMAWATVRVLAAVPRHISLWPVSHRRDESCLTPEERGRLEHSPPWSNNCSGVYCSRQRRGMSDCLWQHCLQSSISIQGQCVRSGNTLTFIFCWAQLGTNFCYCIDFYNTITNPNVFLHKSFISTIIPHYIHTYITYIHTYIV